MIEIDGFEEASAAIQPVLGRKITFLRPPESKDLLGLGILLTLGHQLMLAFLASFASGAVEGLAVIFMNG